MDMLIFHWLKYLYTWAQTRFNQSNSIPAMASFCTTMIHYYKVLWRHHKIHYQPSKFHVFITLHSFNTTVYTQKKTSFNKKNNYLSMPHWYLEWICFSCRNHQAKNKSCLRWSVVKLHEGWQDCPSVWCWVHCDFYARWKDFHFVYLKNNKTIEC